MTEKRRTNRAEGVVHSKEPGNQEDTLSLISKDLTRLTGERIKLICQDCGKEFDALDLGPITRKVCEDCRKVGEEKERAAAEQARAEEEAMRYHRLVRASNIPTAWKSKTFEKLDPTIQPKAQRIAKQYAETFSMNSPGLVFYSDINGTGKTTLAACIANYVLHEKHLSVSFWKARELMLHIRRTFSDDWSGEDESEILGRISSADLLVLDDVGVDPPSNWIFSTYWTVLDRRYDWQLPLVVTTNKPFDGAGELLEDRIGAGANSRLLGLCNHSLINMSGEDLR